ncbi:MAG: hypothetical protein KA796_11990 [Chryseobacterium sp.]|nr:hypothetical protein [Chryseobacterium sp.]
MAVLLYQVGIFIAIQLAAMFGKNSRNTAIALISIFTLLQVFMSWLLFLQFFTIIISYIISNNWFSITEKKLSQKPKSSYKDSRNLKNERVNNSYINSEIKKKGALDVEYLNNENQEAINEIRRKAKNYVDKIDDVAKTKDDINLINKDRQDKLLKMYAAQAQKHKYNGKQ